MKVIHTIHWAQIKGCSENKCGRNGQLLFAVWPAPISADQCFKKAGFTDFDEADDDLWEDEFDDILKSVLSFLMPFGEHKFRAPIEISEYPNPTFEKQVYAPILNDNFPRAVVDFGDPPAATLITGDGHPIFWIVVDHSASFKAFLKSVADGRKLEETQLEWEILL